MKSIHIQGARTHNLKNVSLVIPRQKLVVITGISGSGKSSLAFDTLYAEGQRRYVYSLSTYARQFLQLMNKPDVDSIDGLSPAISVSSKKSGYNPRSTVGTLTEIHDYLRLLYAHIGVPHCPHHGLPLQAQSVRQMVNAVLSWPEKNDFIAILAPIPYREDHSYKQVYTNLQAQGYVRFRINGQILKIDQIPDWKNNHIRNMEVVIDRISIKDENKQRIAESIETGLHLAEGKIQIINMNNGHEQFFYSYYACSKCNYRFPTAMEPQLFSFNNPKGACPHCEGIGQASFFDPKRVVMHPKFSLAAGAITGWDASNPSNYSKLISMACHYKFDLNTPFEQLPDLFRKKILFGSGKEEIQSHYLDLTEHSAVNHHIFEGVIPNLERQWRNKNPQTVRDNLEKYRSFTLCPSCNGSRLRSEARHVFIVDDAGDGEKRSYAIHEIESMSLSYCLNWFQNLTLSHTKEQIAKNIICEIKERLKFLNDIGLNYLSLNRRSDTISGGETQRVLLASQLSSGLTGVMYILDEPSIGLHQRDTERLIHTLYHLRDLGNSVIVVEHNENIICAADWIIDMGPEGGDKGGEIIAQGELDKIKNNELSITGQYLRDFMPLNMRNKHYRPVHNTELPWLILSGACGNNLKNIELKVPIGRLVCVTGVSGSGKSTLINDTLALAVSRQLYNMQTNDPAPYDCLQGLEYFNKIICLDQSPIGRTSRSNPATYTGIFNSIRELFSSVIEARIRGYKSSRFSFNVKGGRCEACQGEGNIKIDMHFLPTLYVPCDMCHGTRYNQETLEIRYRGYNISEILNFTVKQAMDFFDSVPALSRRLSILSEVGLSYIRLGQSFSNLSAGEAQRIKISHELSRYNTGRILYILDEPTTGLHFHDIEMLLQIFNQLVDKGNAVLIIEHNLDIIKAADWIIDLGPEAGEDGGKIIGQGTPHDIASLNESYTGYYLKNKLLWLNNLN